MNFLDILITSPKYFYKKRSEKYEDKIGEFVLWYLGLKGLHLELRDRSYERIQENRTNTRDNYSGVILYILGSYI